MGLRCKVFLKVGLQVGRSVFAKKKSGLRAEYEALNNEKLRFEIVEAETCLLRATKQVSKKKRVYGRKTWVELLVRIGVLGLSRSGVTGGKECVY